MTARRLISKPDGGAADPRGNTLVTAAIGYWVTLTSSPGTLDTTAKTLPLGPCDAVRTDTDLATITGTPAEGSSDADALKCNAFVWDPTSFQSVSAVSAGTWWAGYYRKPAAGG